MYGVLLLLLILTYLFFTLKYWTMSQKVEALILGKDQDGKKLYFKANVILVATIALNLIGLTCFMSNAFLAQDALNSNYQPSLCWIGYFCFSLSILILLLLFIFAFYKLNKCLYGYNMQISKPLIILHIFTASASFIVTNAQVIFLNIFLLKLNLHIKSVDAQQQLLSMIEPLYKVTMTAIITIFICAVILVYILTLIQLKTLNAERMASYQSGS